MILGIYGGAGLGAEVLDIAEQINARVRRWEEILFVNDELGNGELRGKRVLSYQSISKLFPTDAFEFAIAVGEPYFRSLLAARVRSGGYSLATLVHPSSTIFASAKIGQGSVIFPNAFISSDAVIGDNVLLMPSVVVMHESTLGANTVCAAQTNIAGKCRIGEETYFGLSSVLRDKKSVGNRTIIGMGSLVTGDIGDDAVAMGAPARVIRKNDARRVFSK